MGPAMLGLAANAFVAGLAIGVGGWLALRRAKRGGRAGLLIQAAYGRAGEQQLRQLARRDDHQIVQNRGHAPA